MTTAEFDIVRHLDSPEMIAAYLDACMEEGGQELFLEALGFAMKAVGMGKVAADAGVGRTSAYKAFSSEGNPELRTVDRVLHTMGMRLAVVPEAAEAA
ncbi:addiction module antidote protein [Luteimonas sp. A611]